MLYREELLPYRRAEKKSGANVNLKGNKERNSRKSRPKRNGRETVKLAAFYIIAFFCARFSFMNILSPFGIAAYVAADTVLPEGELLFGGLCIIAGYLSIMPGSTGADSNGVLVQAIVHSCMIAIFILISQTFKRRTKNRIFMTAGAAAILDISIRLLFALLGIGAGITQFFIVMVLLEGVLVAAVSLLFAFGIPVYFQSLNHKLLSGEEMVCLGFLLSAAAAGTKGVQIFGLSISDICMYYIIMMASYTYGAGIGSAWGILLGCFVSFGYTGAFSQVGGLGFEGLVTGLFMNASKLLCTAAFAAAGLIVNLNGVDTEQGLHRLIGLGIGIGLFAITPQHVCKKLKALNIKTKEEQDSGVAVIEKVKDMMDRKLNSLSSTLGGLSEVLNENVENELRYETEINSMVERLVDRVCINCDSVNTCWKKDFLFTFDSFSTLLRNIEKLGRISFEDVPKQLKNRCIRPNELIKQSAYLYEIFKLNNKWRKKLINSKIIVSEQMKGITEIMKSMTEEISATIELRSDLEKSIAIALDRSGLEFEDIMAIKNGKGRYEVTVYKHPCGGMAECRREFGTVISRVLGARMIRESGKCRISSDAETCQFRFVEADAFGVVTGISRLPKEEISGDHYSYGEIGGGRYLMALSDGMGSGSRAANESSTTISLLEKFLEAGYDRNTAIKAINSVLVLRSNDESFATIDIGLLDLYTGIGEFIKIGSAPTFIKSGLEIEQLESGSIPAGILDDISVESQILPLKDGDLIIMVSDGVVDADPKSREKWIVQALKELTSGNPKDIAESLLERAKEKYGSVPKDDMTIIVSKIWRVV